MNELLKEYEKRFNDQFPLMCCRGMSDEEIMEAIKLCLEKNEPYEVDETSDY